MMLDGGCYCGALRYHFEGQPVIKGQCHCRECQYFAGGSPNLFIGLPESGFHYTSGSPKTFRRSDLEQPVTREFCAECGTPILSRTAMMPGVAIVKAGTLDDPAQFGGPQMAIFTCDQQSFHHIAPGLPSFERLPPR